VKIYIGDVYSLYREFKQDPTDGKKRPNLVIEYDEDSEDVYILPLTRTAPKTPSRPYDRWKVEIKEWRDAGLDQPSWVNVDELMVVSKTAISADDYRGYLMEDDRNTLFVKPTSTTVTKKDLNVGEYQLPRSNDIRRDNQVRRNSAWLFSI
jgi:hypothetical protein